LRHQSYSNSRVSERGHDFRLAPPGLLQPPAGASNYRGGSEIRTVIFVPGAFGKTIDVRCVRRTRPRADEAAAIELWRRTWQAAYPAIDFSARLAWWRERWRSELVPTCTIMVAETGGTTAGRSEGAAAGGGEIIGFVTVDARTGYLDQIVVAPEAWGSRAATALLAAAKRLAPSGLDLHVNRDNARAIRFYEKHGFKVSGEEVNPRSGAPVYRMSWRP
jgi:putative acetyltransferase